MSCHVMQALRQASTVAFKQTANLIGKSMKVVAVPVRDDNYAYLLIDEASQTAAAVDPYDVGKVSSAASMLS